MRFVVFVKHFKWSLFLFAVAALLGVVYLLAGLPLRQAHQLWRNGEYVEATDLLQRWSRLRLRPGDYEIELAATYLLSDDPGLARPYLDKAGARGRQFFQPITKLEVASKLIAAGRYAEFIAYDKAVRELREPADLALYRTAAFLGTERLALAKQLFERIDADDVDPAKYKALKAAMDDRVRGDVSLVLDRDGKPIASYRLTTRDLVPLDRNFATLIDKEGGRLTIEANLARLGTAATIETTLDRGMQNAAVAALAGYRGSIVVIDVPSNQILAIASTAGDGAPVNLALEAEYEPGSVIKVLTGIRAYQEGVVDGTFPIHCEGFLQIEGKMFYDWAQHDDLPRLQDAMATSCNVAFAQLGHKFGADKLQQTLRAAGFGGKADLGLFEVPLGRLIGEVSDDYSTANAAIGLSHERINALHLAMIGAAVARDGRMDDPELLRARRTILGEQIPLKTNAQRREIAPASAVHQIWPALEAVVVNPRGTGRRAAVEGLPLAMKTGTAGRRVPGYDALIMAFAPAQRPEIAIGVIAEHVGPAEFVGAKIAHDFFQAVAPKLKRR